VVDLIHDVINNFQYLAGRYRDVPAMLLLPCLALAMPLLARWIGWSARWLETAALAVAAAIILVMAFVSGSYLANTGYLDHVEASISAVSWLYRNGDPLYPGWTDGEGIYGLQYGPLLFQVTAAALSLGPSILISKLPAFAGFWLACLVLLWTLRPLSSWLAATGAPPTGSEPNPTFCYSPPWHCAASCAFAPSPPPSPSACSAAAR